MYLGQKYNHLRGMGSTNSSGSKDIFVARVCGFSEVSRNLHQVNMAEQDSTSQNGRMTSILETLLGLMQVALRDDSFMPVLD